MSKKVAETESTENVPAVAGETHVFTVTKMDDLQAYAFQDTNALQILQENLGGQTLTQSDLERIKFPSAGAEFWTVPNLSGKPKAEDELTGILIMQKPSRAYWESDFTGQNTPPNCSSKDCLVGVGTPGGTCHTCPFSQWGSKVSDDPKKQSNAQACKQVNILFLLRPGAVLPTIIQVPPTSLNIMKQFVIALANKKISYRHCVIGLGLEVTKNAGGIEYSRIVPRVISELPNDIAKVVDAFAVSLRDSFDAVQIVRDEE